MLTYILNLSNIPAVGFALHFYTEKDYSVDYGTDKDLEIVYVKNGCIKGTLYDYEFDINEGSFLVFFRDLPLRLHLDGGASYSHCCIQLCGNFTYELYDENSSSNISSGLTLPLITPSCHETEKLKKELFSAVSDIGISREINGLSAAIKGLNILQKLSAIHQKKLRATQSPIYILEYQIKKIIEENIYKKQTVEDIAVSLNKTPNYINHIFKQSCGITIRQYINSEKIRLLCEMIQYHGVSFKVACSNMGIDDVYYGYRLFKKHTGVTPTQYLAGNSSIK